MRTLLVFVTLAALGAVAGAVIVGSLVFDGTVVDHPYERGIAWDEERTRREASGITTALARSSFPQGKNDLVLAAFGPSGAPLEDDRLSLRVGMTSTADHDRTYTARREEKGTFTAPVDFPLRGPWMITVIVERGEDSLEFLHEIRVGE